MHTRLHFEWLATICMARNHLLVTHAPSVRLGGFFNCSSMASPRGSLALRQEAGVGAGILGVDLISLAADSLLTPVRHKQLSSARQGS